MKSKKTDKQFVILIAILAFIVISAMGAAFTHVKEFTVASLPHQGDAFGWVNAIITELVPVACLIVIGFRHSSGRSITFPVCVGAAITGVSIAGQLYAAGHVLPFGAEVLAVLPTAAGGLVGKMAWSEISWRSAEQRRQELAAELAEAAERQRQERAAEQRRLHEQEAAERVRREAVEAAERARRQELDIANAAAAAAAAEAAVAEANARAQSEERKAAEALATAERTAAARERLAAERAEIEARVAASATSQIATQHSATNPSPTPPVGQGHPAVRRSDGPRVTERGGVAKEPRRSADETFALAQATLDTLPATTPRARAIEAVRLAIGRSTRTARMFVPSDWPKTRTATHPAVEAVPDMADMAEAAS